VTGVSLRIGRSTDQSYVANSWASSLGGEFDRAKNAVIDRLLDDPRTRVIVACEETDTDRILGWVAYARIPGARVVEFVLVRKQRRGEGIARAMLEQAGLRGEGPPVIHLYDGRGTFMSPEEFLR
jgi:GNAT superfamily N-acetyltransferase